MEELKMATNKSMLEILERTRVLIKRLDTPMKIVDMPAVLDELQACGAVLKEHIKAQKRQKSMDYGDKYIYSPDTKSYQRVYN